MDEKIGFIKRVDISVAANQRVQEMRTAAVNKMRKEVADFLEACMEDAKQWGCPAMLYKGKEFEIDIFFNSPHTGYCFPEELKKEIEDAGYYFFRNGDRSRTYTVSG